jgi:hypothetical protein
LDVGGTGNAREVLKVGSYQNMNLKKKEKIIL